MVEFICKGCQKLSGTQLERELQNEKFMPTVGFEPVAFRFRSEGATTELRRLMSVEGINNCAIFRNLPAAHGQCNKIICRELHFVDSLQSANFLIGQTAKRYMTKYTTNHFVTSVGQCRLKTL